jgi:oligopeptidase B
MIKQLIRWPAMALTGVLAALAVVEAGDAPRPPVAKKVEHVATMHGESRVDPYHWLRDKGNPEVIAHLEAENAYTHAVMKPTEPLQATLYAEMLGRIKQTDLSVPYLQRGYYYYSRTEEGKQYAIHCRKKGSLDAPEEVILDGNELAEGQPFFSLRALEVSDDNRLLAYSTDYTGFRLYTLRVRDLRTGKDLPDTRETVTSIAWAADNRTLFYGVEDAAKRSYRIHRMRLGGADDDLVYEEADERFRVAIDRTRSLDYLLLTSSSHTSSEVRYLRAADAGGAFGLLAPRQQDTEYYVDHRGDRFYIRVNDTGRNFRLVTAPVATPAPEHWTEVVPHRADVMLQGVLLFKDFLVLTEREQALTQMAVTDLRTGAAHRVAFPEPVYSAFPEANPEFDARALRYVYTSFVTPHSVYDYDMASRERTLLKETEVLGGYDRTLYVSERIHAPAPDGVQVPVSLVYRKDVARDGTAPMHLAGYGAYGIPANVVFNSNRLSLLDRGVVMALAHIRGGSDLGQQWHDDGRMMKKMNTFTDFIAVADHLVAQKYGARDRLVIEGGSAGGLLIGAVVNLRPDLARAAVLQVPFVDVINTMLDETLPLTVGEFEEWGNPRNKAHYDYMKQYCPYMNLQARAYPAMLVTTSLNDSQVMYWEPAKYVARLRTLKSDDRPLIFRINMAAGHGGASGRYDRLREVAFDYAFMLWQMGVPEAARPTTASAAK